MIKSRPRSEVREFGEREGSRLTDKREKGGDRRFCSTDVEESEDAKYPRSEKRALKRSRKSVLKMRAIANDGSLFFSRVNYISALISFLIFYFGPPSKFSDK